MTRWWEQGKAFDESKRAYSSGDGARAKQLSNEGHEHQRKKDNLNKQAAEWIYNGSLKKIIDICARSVLKVKVQR
jgi:hypothetical protein